jgi:hypothetical protein
MKVQPRKSSKMSLLNKEEYLSEQDSVNMMYEFSELMEELIEARSYLEGHLEGLEKEDFFFKCEESSLGSIAQCVGHLAYVQKELGKKAEADFSFRLDIYDELFSNIDIEVKGSELPSQAELLRFSKEIHEIFLEESRYKKKLESVFVLINQYYNHCLRIGKILEAMGKAPQAPRPDSIRVRLRLQEGSLPLYHLPVYAN